MTPRFFYPFQIRHRRRDPQNRHLLRWWLHRCSRISSRRVICASLQTGKNHCRLYSGNMANYELICSPTDWILPKRLHTCALLDYLGRCFLKVNWIGPISYHNIRYWLFFPFEGDECALYHVKPNKLSSCLWWLTEPSWPPMGPIHPEKITVLTAVWFVVSCDKSIFRPRLLNGADISLVLQLNNTQPSFEVVTQLRYRSIVGKHGTYLANGFLSFKIESCYPCGATISPTFILRSANTIS